MLNIVKFFNTKKTFRKSSKVLTIAGLFILTLSGIGLGIANLTNTDVIANASSYYNNTRSYFNCNNQRKYARVEIKDDGYTNNSSYNNGSKNLQIIVKTNIKYANEIKIYRNGSLLRYDYRDSKDNDQNDSYGCQMYVYSYDSKEFEPGSYRIVPFHTIDRNELTSYTRYTTVSTNYSNQNYSRYNNSSNYSNNNSGKVVNSSLSDYSYSNKNYGTVTAPKSNCEGESKYYISLSNRCGYNSTVDTTTVQDFANRINTQAGSDKYMSCLRSLSILTTDKTTNDTKVNRSSLSYYAYRNNNDSRLPSSCK